MVFPGSLQETSSAPQKIQSLEKRQAQYCKVITFDALEELNAIAFQLISADACRRSISGSFQIKIEKFVRKRTHDKPRHADIFEQYGLILDESEGRMKLVRAAGQFAKLSACRDHISRFGKSLAAQRECLVSAKSEAAGLRFRRSARFLPRQMSGHDVWRLRRGIGFEPPFVKINGADFERNAGAFKQGLPHLTARCE